jgi:hypothetical protein
MNYQKDTILPLLISKIQSKTAHLKKMTPEEEGKILSLTKS